MAVQPAVLRKSLGFVVYLVAYYGAYHFAMQFSPQLSAPFWFPDSVLLCALLCTRSSWWWLLLLTTLPIRLLVDVPENASVGFLFAVFANDCAKAALAAWLLKRFTSDPIRFGSMRDFGVYFGITVLLAPVLSALGGAAARGAMGHEFWSAWEQWFLGDAMASLIVTPILFYWVLRPPNPATFSVLRSVEAAAITIGLLVTLTLAFERPAVPQAITESRYYAPLLFIVWAAVRFRIYGATGAIALLTVFTVTAALVRARSLDAHAAAAVASDLQHFLLLRAAPVYLVAVLIEQTWNVGVSLRESEQRFRHMANHAPVMIWLADTGGRCEFVNQQWLDFTGLSLDRFLGSGWTNLMHPDEADSTFTDFMANVQARTAYEDEKRLRRHDGEYRWILTRGQPRFGAHGEFHGFVGSAVDVTDRRQQEAALRRSEARYRDVVESQASFVCRFLPDASLTFVNSAWCAFLGRGRMELLGSSFMELLSPAARIAARDAVARSLASSSPAEWECEVARADGTRGWQQWVCHALEDADEARELQVIGYDITDRKRAEESGRQLAQAARFAALGELTAMVAHEINQPLCAILSNAEAGELMLRSAEPPLDELRNIFADIRQDDLRADAAIRSIRSLVQRREFVPRQVDVPATIDHVFKLVAGDALHRRVPMRCDLGAELPAVLGDRSHLEQVLVILMVNGMDAMKETPEGARELWVSARRVNGQQLEIAVRDRGHGIATENLPQLFESFFTTKADGMGLGLSIARSMITAHGGRIWAENAPDGGAVFRFTLNAAPRLTEAWGQSPMSASVDLT
jgi:PAS domain S-box-containing protein